MAIDLKTIKPAMAVPHAKDENNGSRKIINLLNSEISLWGKGQLKARKKESFYSELSVLLMSGIDIRTALDIIVDIQKSETDKALFQSIRADIIGGSGISAAISTSGKFSAYEYYSLKIGEESGRLKDVMADLSSYFSKKIKQRRQLTSALTYPVLVVMTAVVATVFMLNFIVPMFVDIFKRFNGELPTLTRQIIALSGFFRNYTWLLLLIVLLIAAFLFVVRKTETYRNIVSSLLLRLPVVGDLIKKVYLTRFCQSMSLLLGAKTPMLRSLSLVRHMIGFLPFEKALEKMESDIMHGKLLHQSMAAFTLFDTRIISLVRVAEEVNELEATFERLNSQYNTELEHSTGMLSSLLEPVMIIIVGGLVSLILISMYLPLFQLSTSIY